MVAQRLVEAVVDRGGLDRFSIDVFGEEPRPPYDRVALTSFFTASSPVDLTLSDGRLWATDGVTLHTGLAVSSIEPEGHTLTTADGSRHGYDILVLATGSYAARPPVPGRDLPGCFVYRTLDDVEQLRDWVQARPGARGVVVGGGLLGLEAAGALRGLGAETTVVEFADRLMPLQVDCGGGEALRRLIADLGVEVRTSTATREVLGDPAGGVIGMAFGDGSTVDTDVVVFATGVRPRDDLARQAGLAVHERGGVLAGADCATSNPDIYAIGEVASFAGRIWGLVGPGYTMAEIVADRLLGGDATFTGVDLATKLKLSRRRRGQLRRRVRHHRGCPRGRLRRPRRAACTRSSSLSDDAQTLLGGILSATRRRTPACVRSLGGALAAGPGAPGAAGGAEPPMSGALPDDAIVCSCNNVTAGTIRGADHGTTAAVQRRPATQDLHQGRHQLRLLRAAGEGAAGCRADAPPASRSATRCASTSRCRRPQLFDAVRVSWI